MCETKTKDTVQLNLQCVSLSFLALAAVLPPELRLAHRFRASASRRRWLFIYVFIITSIIVIIIIIINIYLCIYYYYLAAIAERAFLGARAPESRIFPGARDLSTYAYICIYIYIYIHIHTYVHTYTHTHIHTYVYDHISITSISIVRQVAPPKRSSWRTLSQTHVFFKIGELRMIVCIGLKSKYKANEYH